MILHEFTGINGRLQIFVLLDYSLSPNTLQGVVLYSRTRSKCGMGVAYCATPYTKKSHMDFCQGHRVSNMVICHKSQVISLVTVTSSVIIGLTIPGYTCYTDQAYNAYYIPAIMQCCLNQESYIILPHSLEG